MGQSDDKRLSVVIITLDAERKIRECLESVRWADEVIVVDSGSSDATMDIAKEYTDKVYVREFDNFSCQKNYAISLAEGEWILSLDADEIVSEKLAEEIKRTLSSVSEKDGYYVERLNNIYGKFVEYDRPDHQLRLFKKGTSCFTQPVHERLNMSDDKTGILEGVIYHYTMEDITHHVKKIDEFTEYDIDFYDEDISRPLWGLRKLFLRPMLKFIQHYFMKKGYKDGRLGYVFAINTIIGEFLTSAKNWEKELGKK